MGFQKNVVGSQTMMKVKKKIIGGFCPGAPPSGWSRPLEGLDNVERGSPTGISSRGISTGVHAQGLGSDTRHLDSFEYGHSSC